MKTDQPERKSRLETLKENPQETINLGPSRLVIEIDKVIPDPANERKHFADLEGLAASIKKFGMLEPLIVSPNGDGTYKLLIGERRWRANKLAGLTRVEVLVRDQEEESNRRIKSLISNIQRQNLSPLDLATALKDRLDHDESLNSQRGLSDAIGKDETWVSGMLKVLTLPENLQKKLGTSQVSYESVIRIARINDPKIQAILIDELLKGASHGEIRQRIKELQGKAEPKKAKRAFPTSHNAIVIVQSTTSRLSKDQTISALEEALTTARNEK